MTDDLTCRICGDELESDLEMIRHIFEEHPEPRGSPAGKGSFTVRVATAQGKQGKQGISFLLFPDRENTGNFALTQGKFLRHRENIFYDTGKNLDTGKIFDCDY